VDVFFVSPDFTAIGVVIGEPIVQRLPNSTKGTLA
jgi:hypothetical protein